MDSYVSHIMNPQLSVPVSQVQLPKGGIYTGVFTYPTMDAAVALIIGWCKGVDRWRGFETIVLIRQAGSLGKDIPFFADDAMDKVVDGILGLLRAGMVVGVDHSNRVLYPTEKLVASLRQGGYIR